MIPDLFGLLPINLFLGYSVMKSSTYSWYSLFALSRLLALYRLRDLLEKF